MCSVGSIPCAVGDYITIKADASKVSYVVVIYFNGTTFVSSKPVSSNSNIFIVPSGVNNFKYHVLGIDNITPQTVGHVGVYVNNAIDEIKNDLVVLEATSTIEMTASRELDDITSSALTIPSGYKPIAMYGYNEENNDNISAMPLLLRSDGMVLFHAKNHSTSAQGIIHFRIRVTFKKFS